jgi:polysaccharide pyruvyl transferase WcaK-like protein
MGEYNLKTKKKIGVLTYHHVINDGGVLQAYSQAIALKKYFKNENVEIIDYRAKKTIKRERVLYLIGGVIKRDFNRIKKYMKIKRFIKKEMPLSKKKLISDDYKKSILFLKEKYDAIVVGSDEVWKSLYFDKDVKKSGRPFPNIYFLSTELKCKKIALAASANRCEYENISKKNRELGGKLLQAFDFISVRDEHTRDLIERLGVKKTIKVPDPTFTFELKDYDKKIKDVLKKRNVDINKPIVCFRLGSDTPKKIELCKKAKEYFKKKGYQIVSIGGYNKFADINLTGLFNPFEWASVFKFFDFCITDRFHGTIFCLKNGTPFLSVDEDEYYKRIKSKIIDLLEDFSMMDNYLYLDGTDYDLKKILDNIQQSFSKKDVEKKVEMMKKRYYEVLDEIKKMV